MTRHRDNRGGLPIDVRSSRLIGWLLRWHYDRTSREAFEVRVESRAREHELSVVRARREEALASTVPLQALKDLRATGPGHWAPCAQSAVCCVRLAGLTDWGLARGPLDVLVAVKHMTRVLDAARLRYCPEATKYHQLGDWYTVMVPLLGGSAPPKQAEAKPAISSSATTAQCTR